MNEAATDNPPEDGQPGGRPGFAWGEGASSALDAMIKKREMGENEPQPREATPSQGTESSA